MMAPMPAISLLNYDPSARVDMESFMDHIAPESQSWHRHTLEGADDSPAHMRAMITPNSLAIPIDDGHLSPGQRYLTRL